MREKEYRKDRCYVSTRYYDVKNRRWGKNGSIKHCIYLGEHNNCTLNTCVRRGIDYEQKV